MTVDVDRRMDDGASGYQFGAMRVTRPILIAALALAVIVVIVSLILPRTWTATAAFRPQEPASSTSSLAGLAAQFGVALPLEQGAESPDFYADLLRSRAILRPVVGERYPVGSQHDSANLIVLYRLHQATPARDTEEAVKKLQQNLGVSTGLKTGVVTFSVRARAPDLAAEVATRLIAEVNRFNLVTRQTRARQERIFTQGRVQVAFDSLRQSENRITSFLQGNRDYRNAPELQFEHDRLDRDVTLKQQVYSDLVQSLERSRIEEVRNTPVITIIDPPLVPARPDSRQIALKAIATFLLVLGASVVWLLLADSRPSVARPTP